MHTEISLLWHGTIVGFLISLPLGPAAWQVYLIGARYSWNKTLIAVLGPIVVDNIYINIVCVGILLIKDFPDEWKFFAGIIVVVALLIFVFWKTRKSKTDDIQEEFSYYDLAEPFFLAAANMGLFSGMWFLVFLLGGEEYLQTSSWKTRVWFPIGFFIGNVGTWMVLLKIFFHKKKQRILAGQQIDVKLFQRRIIIAMVVVAIGTGFVSLLKLL